MKDNVQIRQNGGIGFFGVLTIVLIVLKLCKVISWSWWLVFMPLIVSTLIGFILGILLIILLVRSEKDEF